MRGALALGALAIALPAGPAGAEQAPAEPPQAVEASFQLPRAVWSKLRQLPGVAAPTLRWREAVPLAWRPWRWQPTSQSLFASNLELFNQGPAALADVRRLRGLYHEYLPFAGAHLLGHLDHQQAAFSVPAYNYGSLTASTVLSHPLVADWHLFEGGALRFRRPDRALEQGLLDTSLFTGLGTGGRLPAGTWYATLTLDRVHGPSLADSYYGQALRLGLSAPAAAGRVSALAVAQRVDPMIVSTPYFRGYMQGTLQAPWGPHAWVGLQTLAGVQLGQEPLSAHLQVGPLLHVSF